MDDEETNNQASKKTKSKKDKPTHKQANRQAPTGYRSRFLPARQTNEQASKQASKQTNRQANKQIKNKQPRNRKIAVWHRNLNFDIGIDIKSSILAWQVGLEHQNLNRQIELCIKI